MIVATHLLSTLAHAHALTHVDRTESEAESKEKEDVEGEVDRLGPEQARSMLALLTGDNLISSHPTSPHLSSDMLSLHSLPSFPFPPPPRLLN
jgi:hypothetical protein